MPRKSGHGLTALEMAFCELPNPARDGSATYVDFAAALEKHTAFRDKVAPRDALRAEIKDLIRDTIQHLVLCGIVENVGYHRVRNDLVRLDLWNESLYRQIQHSVMPRQPVSSPPVAAVA